MDKHLHIVSLTVPYPVNYGGVFDIFYKIVALHAAGIRIHLHCYTNNQHAEPTLQQYCEHIYYYPRETGLKGFSFTRPYIVASRDSVELRNRLLLDDYPVLIEGVHCAALLEDARFQGRKVILRLHNVEYRYYQGLFSSASVFFKKMYFLQESTLLKKFERRIANIPSLIVAVSVSDENIYRDQFGAKNIRTLPVFIGEREVTALAGTGEYCLYHGNLSVPENEKAVNWLLDEIFYQSPMPLVIAGKDPGPLLANKITKHKNCTLITNPDEEQLMGLIRNAQCHVLPSFNSTGVKLKLINALYAGRFCIVNSAAVHGSGLEVACIIANTAKDFGDAVRSFYRVPFTKEQIHSRTNLLKKIFNAEENCRQLIQWIW